RRIERRRGGQIGAEYRNQLPWRHAGQLRISGRIGESRHARAGGKIDEGHTAVRARNHCTAVRPRHYGPSAAVHRKTVVRAAHVEAVRTPGTSCVAPADAPSEARKISFEPARPERMMSPDGPIAMPVLWSS